MKVIHIKCEKDEKTQRPLGITKIEGNRYMSCCWYFDLEEMKELIGGQIFFHNSKSERSKLGGTVINVHPITMTKDYDGPYYTYKEEDEGKRSDRMMFEFEIDPSLRGVKWRGKSHMYSYCGGIVEVDD